MNKLDGFLTFGMSYLVLATGCIATVDDGGETTATTSAEALTYSPAVGSSTSYVWGVGYNPVTMTSQSNTVCFLTEIRGLFRSTNDRVRIQHTASSWVLDGTVGTNEGRPAAGARCLNLTGSMGWSGAYSWSAGQAPTDLGSSSSRACYLVEVSGRFDETTDTVRTRISNGHWWLDGLTDSGAAVARCVSSVSLFGSTQTVVNEGETLELFVNSAANGPRACFLTQVGGVMLGAKLLPQLPPSGSASIVVGSYRAGPTAYPYVIQVQSSITPLIIANGGTRCIQ